jgi:quercetin dioxygenase-like cupin family protein
MQKESLPPHQKDGTGGSKTLTLAELAGKQVICKTFVAGDQVPARHVPTDVFMLVLDGQMDISMANETNRFLAGDYILIGPGITHSLACMETARLLLYE